MRFRCHGKRIDRYRVHTTVLSGGRRGGTPLHKRNDGRRQRNVPRSLQHEQNRLKNCLCRNSPKTISSNSTHFQQSSMYKTFDHLRCFSAYSFSPLCREARFIPRLTKTQVTPRRSNNKSSFCNTVEQTNLHLRPPGLRSKRLRLVSEKRKTEEQDSRVWPREKWEMKHFSRGLWLLFLVLYS